MTKLRAVVAAALISAIGLTALPNNSAQAAPRRTSVDPVGLWAPTEMTLNIMGGQLYNGIGVRVAANGEDFQIWSHRPDYDSPIVSEWVRPGGTMTLPDSLMTDFNGLPDFVKVTFRTSDGTWVKSRKFDFCPSYDVARVSPDGASINRYPEGCPFHPYTVGSVMGIPDGWASAITNDYRPLHLADGDYTVTARINEPYLSTFGLNPAANKVTFVAHVINDSQICPDCPPEGARQHWQSVRRGGGDLRSDRRLVPGPRPTSARAGLVAGPTPDLQSLPAFGMTLNEKGTQIRFGATVWNGGESPLIIDGFRNATDPDLMDAYQYFFDADGNQTGYQQVGSFHWHALNHNHWHYEDFARYRLLNADLSEAVLSRKNSFCLAATDAVDYTVPGALWHPYNTDLRTACGDLNALSIREALPSGSGDTYFQYRSGQSFGIKNLLDGDYWIAVEANPDGNIVETDTTNNVAYRKITLGHDTLGNRTLVVAPVGIINENWWF